MFSTYFKPCVGGRRAIICQVVTPTSPVDLVYGSRYAWTVPVFSLSCAVVLLSWYPHIMSAYPLPLPCWWGGWLLARVLRRPRLEPGYALTEEERLLSVYTAIL
jgi:hypothetical protein